MDTYTTKKTGSFARTHRRAGNPETTGRYYTSDARIGLFHELRRDFRLIGKLDEYDEAYERAADRYERVENDLGWSMEGGFEDVVDSAGIRRIRRSRRSG